MEINSNSHLNLAFCISCLMHLVAQSGSLSITVASAHFVIRSHP